VAKLLRPRLCRRSTIIVYVCVTGGWVGGVNIVEGKPSDVILTQKSVYTTVSTNRPILS